MLLGSEDVDGNEEARARPFPFEAPPLGRVGGADTKGQIFNC